MKFKKIIATVLTGCLLVSTISVAASATGVSVKELDNGSKVITAASVEEAMDYLAESNTDCIECTAPETDNWTRKTDCDGKCGHAPAIIVPGILQSQVYLQDENGNDLVTESGAPIMESMDMQYLFDMDKLADDLPKLISPLINLLATKDSTKFVDALNGILNDNLGVHYFNDDGTRDAKTSAVEYWYSLEVAETKPDKFNLYQSNPNKHKTEAEAIYKQVNTREYASIAGADHVYYFAYPSFGDTYETAEKFNQFVQMVKSETGHAKVNVVFISLGGTIGTAYFDAYCNPDDINKAIFASSALDGSCLLGDIFKGDFTLDDAELIYNDILPNLLSFAGDDIPGYAAYLLNILLRLVPKSVGKELINIAEQVVENLVSEFLAKCPSMWALIPSGDYTELSEKYLSDPSRAALKEKTDRYHQAQITNKTRIPYLNENTDMTIFAVCGYGLHIPALLESYCTEHSDEIIQANSQAMGAYFAPIGTTLPEDYVPAIDETYISPNRIVDAGAGYMPDNTWFVYGQSHLELQSSVNDYISMCIHIALDDDIKDARVNNGGYSQFQDYRDSSMLNELKNMLNKVIFTDVENRVYNMELINSANPTDAQLQELYKISEEAIEVLNTHSWDNEKATDVRNRMVDLLDELELNTFDYETSKDIKIDVIIIGICKKISDIVSKIFGSKSFFG